MSYVGIIEGNINFTGTLNILSIFVIVVALSVVVSIIKLKCIIVEYMSNNIAEHIV